MEEVDFEFQKEGLSKKSEKEKAVFFLYQGGYGLRFEEIAEVLEIAIKTVKKYNDNVCSALEIKSPHVTIRFREFYSKWISDKNNLLFLEKLFSKSQKSQFLLSHLQISSLLKLPIKRNELNTLSEYIYTNGKPEESRKAYSNEVHSARKDGWVSDYLIWHYQKLGCALLTVQDSQNNDVVYPCLFIKNPNEAAKLSSIDEAIIMDWTGTPQNVQNDFEFIYHRMARQPDLLTKDLVTFALGDISVQNKVLKIKMYPSSFTLGLITAESIGWELMKAIFELRFSVNQYPKEEFFTLVSRSLHLRNRVDNLLGNNFFDGRGRVANFGVSMFFVYKDHETYKFIANIRKNVATQGNVVHTLPAGMFQTDEHETSFMLKKTRQEYLIEKRIMCEWLEEVYNLKEYKETKTTDPYTEIQKDTSTPMPELMQLIESGKAELFCSGVALDLINLRPEICTVLIVHEHNAKIVDTMCGSDESQGSGLKAISKWKLQDLIDREPLLMEYLAPKNTVASGMAAIWKGLEIVKAKLNL